VFICNRPLSAVLAALAAATAFVVADELYRQHSESTTESTKWTPQPASSTDVLPVSLTKASDRLCHFLHGSLQVGILSQPQGPE
jgi:erythromycin esterase-like protein